MAIVSDPQQSNAKPVEMTDTRIPVADESGGASLEKVRDILFGGQMRDLDRRFMKVEERLAQDTADLKEDLRRRLASLEQFARTETEALLERIKTEHDERTDATGAAARDLQAATTAIDRRMSGLDDQLSRAQRELRQQILDVHQRLADEIAAKVEAVIGRLNREVSELRADKAGRMALAALFTEIATRLTYDPAGSGEQE